jgi:hypothetical protein
MKAKKQQSRRNAKSKRLAKTNAQLHNKATKLITIMSKLLHLVVKVTKKATFRNAKFGNHTH